MTPEILTGKTDAHLVELPDGLRIHKEVVGPLRALQAEARRHHFEIKVVSAFRDYPTQLRIWNDKALGKRPVLDALSRPLDVKALSPEKLLFSILRWSALPGASRHHWGTDFDVIDGARCPPGYQVQLVPQETVGSGPFAAMHLWLDVHLEPLGFFRPYREDRGGVSPERWHLSFAPVAEAYRKAYTLDRLVEVLEHSSMELREVALRHAPLIYARYVNNICPPQPMGKR